MVFLTTFSASINGCLAFIKLKNFSLFITGVIPVIKLEYFALAKRKSILPIRKAFF